MNLKLLGTVARAHGVRGAFKVHITASARPMLENGKPVFIRLQGGPVPFFIEEVKMHRDDSVVLKVEDVNLSKDAEQLVSSEVLLPAETMVDDVTGTIDPIELTGYRVEDEKHGVLGSVQGVQELPQQIILEVKHPNGTVLIPLVVPIVQDVDPDEQRIRTAVPDGLVELYTNG